MKKLTVAAAVAAALLVQPAIAEEFTMNFYAGVAGGITYASDFCDGLSSCDDNDFSFKVFAGIQPHKNFAIEASYANLGELTGTEPFYGIDVSAEATAFTLQAMGILPVGETGEFFVKAGAAFWDIDATAAIGGIRVSDSFTGTDPVIGMGTNINVTDRFAVRFEWDFFPNFGDKDDTGEAHLMNYSLGAQYRF